jgi:inosose dehydratase
MKIELDHRDFAKVMAVGLGAAALPALRAQQPPARAPQGPKNIKIGLSTLAWNVSTNSIDNFEMALKDTSELGYWSFETVSPIIEAFDKDGTLARLIEKYKVPMKAGYLGVNVTDPSVRKENIEKVIRIAKLVKSMEGITLSSPSTAADRQGPVDADRRDPTPSITKNTKRTWSPL